MISPPLMPRATCATVRGRAAQQISTPQPDAEPEERDPTAAWDDLAGALACPHAPHSPNLECATPKYQAHKHAKARAQHR